MKVILYWISVLAMVALAWFLIDKIVEDQLLNGLLSGASAVIIVVIAGSTKWITKQFKEIIDLIK